MKLGDVTLRSGVAGGTEGQAGSQWVQVLHEDSTTELRH